MINSCPIFSRGKSYTVGQSSPVNILLPINGLHHLCLALLDEILPLLNGNFRFLHTAIHGFITYKLSRLLGAVNGKIAGGPVLLLPIVRLGRITDFLCKLVSGKFHRPLLWQDAFTLFFLNRGARLNNHRRVFFSYDSDKMHLLDKAKMRPKLGRISTLIY